MLEYILAQLVIGLINGSLYAIMSLGVAIIFGTLRVANFAHGSQYMLGAFFALGLLHLPEIFPGLGLPSLGYWWAFLIVPVLVGLVGMATEYLFIRRVYNLDHAYGLLLTVGLTLITEGVFRVQFGAAGFPYQAPPELSGGFDLGFLYLPSYRAWVIAASAAICFGTWYLIERTPLGASLRGATENPVLVRAFGINVPRLLTLTYGFGVGLAGLAGVMAAPIFQVNPLMGQNIIVVVFAVVVIGGMGSILGAIISGLALGMIEGLAKVVWPEASSTVIFVVMAIVLLLKPAGLLGRPDVIGAKPAHTVGRDESDQSWAVWLAALLLVAAVTAPLFAYPLFVANILCFALFASAYNLVFGFAGLLGFGHAAFLGIAGYVTAHTAKHWGITPELAILLGASASGVAGILFGWIAIRRKELYFAMITLALAQIVYFYAVQAQWTGGEDGIQAVPRGYLFGVIDLNDTLTIYYACLCVCLLGLLAIYRIIRSPFGESLKAIRENEPRTISLGYEADRIKLVAFALSAFFSGLAGAMKAIVFQVATLVDVHFLTSGDVLLMTLLGGIGTILGPIVGAAIFVTLQNQLVQLGSWVHIIQGATFVVCILLFRSGVVGSLLMASRRKAKS